MPEPFKVIPTIERPFRAIPVDVSRSFVQGDYQCVVALPGSATKGQLYLAYAEACRSLAELAEKWASEEGVVAEEPIAGAVDSDYRICFRLSLRPERGVTMTKSAPLHHNSEGSEARNLQRLPPGVEICLNNRVVSRHDVPDWKPQPKEQYESD